MLVTRRHDELERDGPDSEKRYLGEYLAFVRDSNDPELRGRVRAYCPEVMGEVDSTETWLDWAEAKHFMAGFDQGFMAVPPDPSWLRRDAGGESSPFNQTRIWITFRNGDPARPVYSVNGSWQGANEIPHSAPKLITMDSGGDESTSLPNYITSAVRYKTTRSAEEGTPGTVSKSSVIEEPKPQTNAQYPFNHIYKSPAGHVIEMDNTLGAERFRLYHPAGSSFEINESGSWATKVQGRETKFIVEDATRIVKGSATDVVEGTNFKQVNRSSEEIYRDSRLVVVERQYDSYYKGGWSIVSAGQVDLKCGNFDVESVGAFTSVSGGAFAVAADSVTIGGNTAEMTSNATAIKSLTGVKLSIGEEALAVHPIYASLLINAVMGLSLKATEVTTAALEAAAKTGPGAVLEPAAVGVRAIQTLLTAWNVAFSTFVTTHKVSFP